MWTMNFLMFKLVLEKAEEPEIKLPTSTGSWKKQESSRKNIHFCFLDYAKAFDCVDHNKLWNILKEMGILLSLPNHNKRYLGNIWYLPVSDLSPQCVSAAAKKSRLPSYDPSYLPGCTLFIQPQNGDINSTWIFLRIKIIGTCKVLTSLVYTVFNLSRPTAFWPGYTCCTQRKHVMSPWLRKQTKLTPEWKGTV